MLHKTLLSMTAVAMLATPAMAQDIVDTAIASGKYSKLVEALEAAGLVETLKGEGPFTVFAPSDIDAFSEVDEGGEFEQLLMDVPKLTSVLTYHVVPGKIMSADLTEGMTLTTVQGGDLTITLEGGPKVNGANIVVPDIEASNGVIHEIDALLMPPE